MFSRAMCQANEDYNCYTFDMRKLDKATMVHKDHVGAVYVPLFAPLVVLTALELSPSPMSLFSFAIPPLAALCSMFPLVGNYIALNLSDPASSSSPPPSYSPSLSPLSYPAWTSRTLPLAASSSPDPTIALSGYSSACPVLCMCVCVLVSGSLCHSACLHAISTLSAVVSIVTVYITRVN